MLLFHLENIMDLENMTAMKTRPMTGHRGASRGFSILGAPGPHLYVVLV